MEILAIIKIILDIIKLVFDLIGKAIKHFKNVESTPSEQDK